MVDDETLPDVPLRPLPGSERAAAPEVRAAASPLPADTRLQATLVLAGAARPTIPTSNRSRSPGD